MKSRQSQYPASRPARPTRIAPEGYTLTDRDDLSRALLWMVLSSAGFAMMAAMVKLAGDLPLSEKVFCRNLVTLAITSAVALQRGENPLAPTPHWRLLLLRSLCGLGGVTFYFTALSGLPLADAALLNKLSPVFVMVFAVAFLKEKLARGIVPALLVALLGAALVIKPRFDYQIVPALAGLGSALFSGLAYTFVRALKQKESPNRIVFIFSLVSTMVTLPMVLIWGVWPQGVEWLYLLGTGVFAAVGQYALTLAYHHARASRVSMFTYLHVLFSALIGLLLFNERPDVWTVAGAALIFSTAMYIHRTGRTEAKNTRG